MLYIILIIVIILLLLSFWIFIMYQAFDANIVRIKEVETNIDALLKKRFDLLSKSIPVIKANIESN